MKITIMETRQVQGEIDEWEAFGALEVAILQRHFPLVRASQLPYSYISFGVLCDRLGSFLSFDVTPEIIEVFAALGRIKKELK